MDLATSTRSPRLVSQVLSTIRIPDRALDTECKPCSPGKKVSSTLRHSFIRHTSRKIVISPSSFRHSGTIPNLQPTRVIRKLFIIFSNIYLTWHSNITVAHCILQLALLHYLLFAFPVELPTNLFLLVVVQGTFSVVQITFIPRSFV